MIWLKLIGVGAVVGALALAGLGFPQKKSELKLVALNKIFDDGREKNFSAPTPGSYNLPIIKQAGDGALLDINAKPIQLKELTKGKISIISFVYTTCSQENGCSLSMSTLFDIFHSSEKISGIGDHANLITISFDPERDTPEAMASYGTAALADVNKSKKIPWHFLTASSSKKLVPVLQSYGQAIIRQKNNDTIDHLLRLYLVDRNGKIRNIYGLGFMDPRLLYADIYTLLLEDGTIVRAGT